MLRAFRYGVSVLLLPLLPAFPATPLKSAIPAKDKEAGMIPRETGGNLPENRLPENLYPDLEKTRFRSLEKFTVPPSTGAFFPVLLPAPTSGTSLAPLSPVGRGNASDPMEDPDRPGNDSIPGGPGGEVLPTVRLVPTSTPVREGDSVIVEVRIEAAAGIRSAPFHLLYPADLVEFEDAHLFTSHQQEIRGRFMPANVEINPAPPDPPES